MSTISLEAFATYYKVNDLRGLAKICGLWPSASPVSMKTVLRLIGAPLQPSTPIDGDPGLTAHPYFTWTDPGANSLIAASSWNWTVVENVSGGGHATVAEGTLQTPYTGLEMLTLKTDGGTYFFSVIPVNQFGAGPAADSAAFQTPLSGSGGGGNSSSPALSQPTISTEGAVEVSGSGFNANATVYLQATVIGGSATPNLEATNSRDARNQHVETSANASGKIQATISPQGFPVGTFTNGEVAYILAGETIEIVGANANVGNYEPGSGVSNVVGVPVPATIGV